MLRVVVIDDEKYMLESVLSIFKKIPEVNVVAEFTKPKLALNWLRDNYENVDAVFLDVSMPVLSGFAIADVIVSLDQNISVVFITAHDQYAVKAFEVAALDYILKPATLERLKVVVQRIYKHKKEHTARLNVSTEKQLEALARDELWEKKKIKVVLRKKTEEKRVNEVLLYRDGNWEWVKIDTIYYFYKDKNNKYVNIVTKEKLYETVEKLTDFLEIVQCANWLRCYRNIFVNRTYIERVEKSDGLDRGGLIRLKNSDVRVPISRGYLDDVLLFLHGKQD